MPLNTAMILPEKVLINEAVHTCTYNVHVVQASSRDTHIAYVYI